VSGGIRAGAIQAIVVALLAGQTPTPYLNSITAANLKGDLSFLASDALKGRYTPSPELEIAAEFIASQFRAAGLEPGGNHDYFQTADMIDRHMGKALSAMTIEIGGRTVTIPAASVAVTQQDRPASIAAATVFAVKARDPAELEGVDLSGKAVVAPSVDFFKMPREQAHAAYGKMRAFDRQLESSKAAVEIVVTDKSAPASGPALITAEEAAKPRLPRLAVASEELKNWLAHAAASDQATVSVEFSAPDDRRVTLKNVVGVLRGSDPQLKNTYVLLTAHYDHLGTRETADGMANPEAKQNLSDPIYNGANDNGSGTVSVIEIGRALAKLRPHPKRSIVFMTFFGEERGEIGSEFYAKHPLFPLAKTVADVNLEQMGRTDSTVGKQIRNASLTGYDYSEVTTFMERAGRETGIRVYKDPQASDPYFTQSDNAPFAEQGVPAETLCVAFDFPDYHGVGDEWQKIDYDNMARVDRMVALGLIHIANRASPPRWNAQNPKTAAFRQAQSKLSAQ
jgi:Zn-dependent M28 family amino/carboxypeptidase